MHDIKFIRENPSGFDEAMKKRGETVVTSKAILEIDEQARAKITEVQELQSRRNDIAKSIGMAKSKGEDASHLMKEAESLKEKIPALEAEVSEIQSKLNEILIRIPNILQDDVPFGRTEEENVEIKKWGEIKNFNFEPKEHNELGEKLGMMDFEQTAKISGSRFVTLSGALAKLERALVNFMLDNHTQKFGYKEVVHPALIKSEAAFGTGQLPKFEEDLFKTNTNHWLISTSEMYLTNLVADSIIDEEKLPLRFTAYSQCFRSEAGSAGKDTTGMIRVHQFSKVELISITTEKDSKEEHERMLSVAEDLLQQLELPYRIVKLCSGDTGFSATKTYDIEVWLPGQKKYREISSCSNCSDFQGRRMKARYKKMSDRKNYLVHTLNGSGLPLGRTIIAIMENYQNADGSITVPQKLRQYMSGQETIK